MPTTTRENRARRLASDHGMRIRKLSDDAGYWLIDTATNSLVIGDQITHGVDIGFDLDTIEQYLSD